MPAIPDKSAIESRRSSLSSRRAGEGRGGPRVPRHPIGEAVPPPPEAAAPPRPQPERAPAIQNPEFGQRLQRLRAGRGLQPQDVAGALNLPAPEYEALEAGREPDFSLLMRLCRYFGVSADFLVGLSDSRVVEDFTKKTGLSEEVLPLLSKGYKTSTSNDDDIITYGWLLNQILLQKRWPDLVENIAIFFDDETINQLIFDLQRDMQRKLQSSRAPSPLPNLAKTVEDSFEQDIKNTFFEIIRSIKEVYARGR